jgi:hypothetical protein
MRKDMRYINNKLREIVDEDQETNDVRSVIEPVLSSVS